jgi:alpha-L-fucosidase
MKLNKIISLLTGLALSVTAMPQAAGDEELDLHAQGNKRDNQALETARNGWWSASQKTLDQRLEWWRDARFGMFIHWGVYSLTGR